MFEAVGAFNAGKMSEGRFRLHRAPRHPRRGACGGMYTANTMSSAFEALGMSRCRTPAPWRRKTRKKDLRPNRARAGGSGEKRLKPRDIVTRQSIENAVAVIMAVGGSTNAVLHFLAIAHAADVEWTIDDF